MNENFLMEFATLWEENCPNWTFGQLISNFILGERRDPYAWSNEKFIKEFDKFCETYFRNQPQDILEEFLQENNFF